MDNLEDRIDENLVMSFEIQDQHGKWLHDAKVKLLNVDPHGVWVQMERLVFERQDAEQGTFVPWHRINWIAIRK